MADLKEIGKQAKAARYILAGLDTDTKNKALFTAAECLEADAADILAENAKDLEAGRSRSMPEGLLDRLSLTQKRISDMAEGLRQVAALPDPVGEILDTFTRPNGLVISKRRVPLDVIGIIYESRPNVTADAFGLCFKAGNAVILKGGSDAIFSNLAIEKSLHRALAQCNIPETAVQLIPSTDQNGRGKQHGPGHRNRDRQLSHLCRCGRGLRYGDPYYFKCQNTARRRLQCLRIPCHPRVDLR